MLAVLACLAAACNPGTGGGAILAGPPVATIHAPAESTVEVTPGTSVAFSGTCSVPAATHLWDFGGAEPSASAAATPGEVLFAAEGTYPVSYRCTSGAELSPVARRTVIVRQPRASAFQLELRYLTPVTDAQRAAFEAAAARIREVVVGAVPVARASAVSCGGATVSEDVPGLLVLVSVSPVDGPGKILAQAGPCALRGGDGLPFLGELELDSEDLANLEAGGRLRSVVLHELLHTVGFGTLWDKVLTGEGSADPRFTGPRAEGAYLDWNGGLTPTVPVEGTGGAGTRDAHWREKVFGDELMTGWISGPTQPLSRTTIASLADLGYEVEPLAAEPFAVKAGASLQAGPREDDLELVEDVRRVPPVVVY
jgi:hypothetical protein